MPPGRSSDPSPLQSRDQGVKDGRLRRPRHGRGSISDNRWWEVSPADSAGRHRLTCASAELCSGRFRQDLILRPRSATSAPSAVESDVARYGSAITLGNRLDRQSREKDPLLGLDADGLEDPSVLDPFNLFGRRQPIDPGPIVHPDHQVVGRVADLPVTSKRKEDSRRYARREARPLSHTLAWYITRPNVGAGSCLSEPTSRRG